MLHYYNLTLKENLTGVGFSLQDFKTWKKKLLQVYPPNNVPDRGPIPLEGIIANIYRNMNDQMKRHPTLERKDLKLKSLTQTLKTIIGMEYFGTTSNRNRFFYIVTRILTQNYGECIHMSNLYENFVVEGFSWIDRSKKMDVQIFRANILLLETVVKPFINHYCCFIYMYRHREYLVVLRGDADSFKDKNLAQSIKQGFLEKVPSHKARPKCAIGILTFIPKKNIKMYIHRPLLKLFASKKSLNITIKVNLNKLTKEYQLETHPDLFQRWKIFLMSKRYSNKLYAIKVDLVDAFGMIDTDVLKSIIIKDDKHLTAFQKDLLIKTIGRSYFYVRGKKILYKWHHGLLQGSTLSPILCDLYLSYLTYNYLRSFNTPNTFLHRTVDDILFITVNEYMLNDFEVAIFTMSILNEGKTHKYIDPKIDDPRIVFCGKVFNLETKETSSAFNFPKGRELRGRFKIWNINKQFSTTQAKEFVFNALSILIFIFHHLS
ncbi:uncharacterized protein [Euwallacea fornicatus]|uniref:uncharacterized protein isoform X2 n=1 Tax=Euwallacea fornicatus TaxID=995702 RepID=UPI00338E71AF